MCIHVHVYGSCLLYALYTLYWVIYYIMTCYLVIVVVAMEERFFLEDLKRLEMKLVKLAKAKL